MHTLTPSDVAALLDDLAQLLPFPTMIYTDMGADSWDSSALLRPGRSIVRPPRAPRRDRRRHRAPRVVDRPRRRNPNDPPRRSDPRRRVQRRRPDRSHPAMRVTLLVLFPSPLRVAGTVLFPDQVPQLTTTAADTGRSRRRLTDGRTEPADCQGLSARSFAVKPSAAYGRPTCAPVLSRHILPRFAQSGIPRSLALRPALPSGDRSPSRQKNEWGGRITKWKR